MILIWRTTAGVYRRPFASQKSRTRHAAWGLAHVSSAASAAKPKAATSSPQASYINGAVLAADGGRDATP